ncbi:Zinc finger CCCH domain-containing protein [Actinidia chinensis var. chinensis]|uniref:Zinc finger CCCH domain-containing protein n=1 Tax=Actinidia chinensis var. chinensis TaxID=1590841 RepID=A0A2R6PPA2_ACTCC|nr:Zinc finger CCCH domain-containing protein [Actinidia chinensis var. chinensis]
MDSGPVVLDISSDEENCDGFDWLSELLHEAMGEGDGSDDLVLVGEVAMNPKQRLKSSNVEEKRPVNDLDDDCVVLDGDPDKPAESENNWGGGDSDDLLIVGEKGQIACRDYPHSRHLCVKFPFNSTPHERHCHQCHCYVCDSLAPCVNWGNGTSIVDHCHATDKDEIWNLQRQNFKQFDKASLPGSKLPDTSLLMQLPQTNQCLPPTQMQPTSLAQNQTSGQTTIRACSRSSNFGIPNITNQGGSQQYVHVPSSNKFYPHLVTQYLLNMNNKINLRDTRQKSRTMFKRPGSAGIALAMNRSGYSSSDNNHAYQHSQSPSPVAASPTGWRGLPSRMTSYRSAYNTPSLQNTGGNFGNLVPSQPRVSSHSNMGSVFLNSVPSQPRASSHPNMGRILVNSVHSQLGVSSQPNMPSSFVNAAPSPQAFSQLNMTCNFENTVPSQLQESSQPNTGSIFENLVPSETHVYCGPIKTANDWHDGFQQGNETQSALDLRFSDINTSWVSPNQQTSADNSQVQSAAPTYHLPLLAEFDPLLPLNTNPGSLDFQFDSWMHENPSVSEASGLNLYSPEPALLDEGFLFDF